jgi:hypothetical protein
VGIAFVNIAGFRWPLVSGFWPLRRSRLSDTMAGQTGKKYYLAEEGAVAECFFGANSKSVQLDCVNEYLI